MIVARCLLALPVVIALGLASPASAVTTFYTDATAWQNAAAAAGAAVNQTSFTPGNLDLTTELTSQPASGSSVGTPLTFPGPTFDPSFRISSPDGMYYWGPSQYVGVFAGHTLSNGSTGNHGDFTVDLLGGRTVRGFAFTLVDSDNIAGESFTAYRSDGAGGFTSVGSTSSIPTGSTSFLGVISTDDLVRLIFDEHVSDGDGTGFADFRFAAIAVPEPVSLALAGLAALGILTRRFRSSSPRRSRTSA